MGCAVYPEDAAKRKDLLECADARMYSTKRKKKRVTVRTRALAQVGPHSVDNEGK